MAGTAIAASKLPKNSVNSRSIKNGQVKTTDLASGAVKGSKLGANAVNGSKVADGSLTGSDLLESSLGRVPSAALADTATTAGTATTAAPATAAADAGLLDGIGRSERGSLRSIGPISNPLLLWGIAFELVLTAAFIYLPPFQSLLGTAALTPAQMLIVVPFPLIVWGADEIRRYFVRRRAPADSR